MCLFKFLLVLNYGTKKKKKLKKAFTHSYTHAYKHTRRDLISMKFDRSIVFLFNLRHHQVDCTLDFVYYCMFAILNPPACRDSLFLSLSLSLFVPSSSIVLIKNNNHKCTFDFVGFLLVFSNMFVRLFWMSSYYLNTVPSPV